MHNKPKMYLIITLMMFPQIIETIYSPVLPHLATAFSVSVDTAAQTLSVYFAAFALGVVFWGRIADLWGRRPTMIAGLATYGIGSILALAAQDFSLILFARILSAFGAAVGSVVTQTMLRDSYEGKELAQVFTIMGMGISISPVIGLISGGVLAEFFGHYGVFSALLILAICLIALSVAQLPETRPKEVLHVNLFALIRDMVNDRSIWFNALLVALFNLMLFSYYSLAPFIFSSLGYSSIEFGYSGIALAAGSLLGSIVNKQLLKKNIKPSTLVKVACVIALLGALGVVAMANTIWFLLPMLFVVSSFGIAIPNVLSHALVGYKVYAGSAGAVFGLIYYLMLAAGLGIAGIIQNLGLVLLGSALLCFASALWIDKIRH